MNAKLDNEAHEYPVHSWELTRGVTLGHVQGHAQSPIQTTTLREYDGSSGQRPFPFFDLPQEIRDLIYSHLVVYTSSDFEAAIVATKILKTRQKQITAKASRERLNRQRSASGARPIRCRPKINEPSLHLNLLRTSRRMYAEASDYLYSKNCFHISLNKLPSTMFEAPYGWDFSRIKKLQLDLQLKDAIRMDRYVDWRSFLSYFPSLQYLRIEPTFHPRYYEWAYPELSDWNTTHYVHKAFFRELLTAIPYHIILKIGAPPNLPQDKASSVIQRVDSWVLLNMYTELGFRVDRAGRRLPATCVVDYDQERKSAPQHLRPITMALGPYCLQTNNEPSLNALLLQVAGGTKR